MVCEPRADGPAEAACPILDGPGLASMEGACWTNGREEDASDGGKLRGGGRCLRLSRRDFRSFDLSLEEDIGVGRPDIEKGSSCSLVRWSVLG